MQYMSYYYFSEILYSHISEEATYAVPPDRVDARQEKYLKIRIKVIFK